MTNQDIPSLFLMANQPVGGGKKRLEYLDVAKGLLIVMVVLFHIPHICKGFGANDTGTLRCLSSATVWYTTFFMQAFFFITGWCSNFSKPWKTFAINDIRSILLPAFCIELFTRLLFAPNFAESLHGFVRSWMFYGGSAWFFPSLFLAKELMWLTHRILSYRWQILVLIIVFILGLIWAQHNRLYSAWNLCNSMALLPSMWIGAKYKHCGTQVYEKVSLLLYPSLLLFVYSIGVFPYIMQDVCITYLDFPLYLLLSCSGTLALIHICRYFCRLRILSFVGKHTLFIYALHWTVAVQVIKVFSRLYPRETLFDNLALLVLLSIIMVIVPIMIEYIFTYIKTLILKFSQII